MSNYSCLIIDDDEDILLLHKEIVQGTNLFNSVTIAESALVALRKMENQQFDIILLDINMPKLNGIALIENYIKRKTQNDKRKLPFIIISGNIEKNYVERLLKFGVTLFLTKPLNLELLTKKIRQQLNIKN